MIGTLIETNDRIIAALETYDTVRFPVSMTCYMLTVPVAHEALSI